MTAKAIEMIDANKKKSTERFTLRTLSVADNMLVPFVFVSGCILKIVRGLGIVHFPLSKNILLKLGVFPIVNHYYEPQFDMRHIRIPFERERRLPGIDWNVQEQLKTLDTLNWADELANNSEYENNQAGYKFNNDTFLSGDTEFWYQIIRAKKPNVIIEIGSGNSTLIAMQAIKRNKSEDANYHCNYFCVEPYNSSWLEKLNITAIKKKVEDIEVSFFSKLNKNDILFIDSSHMIRPQGDVLFEYLQLLPTLNRGVIVHVHDIFSPRNYPNQWLRGMVRFWNEQYLLEAFLTHNSEWKIIGALNYLHHHYFDKLKRACPYLEPCREPGSFYIQKVN